MSISWEESCSQPFPSPNCFPHKILHKIIVKAESVLVRVDLRKCRWEGGGELKNPPTKNNRFLPELCKLASVFVKQYNHRLLQIYSTRYFNETERSKIMTKHKQHALNTRKSLHDMQTLFAHVKRPLSPSKKRQKHETPILFNRGG